MIASVSFVQKTFERFNALCFEGVLPAAPIVLTKAGTLRTLAGLCALEVGRSHYRAYRKYVMSTEFSEGSSGKPFLRDYPGIFFNISHCHRGIACAVMDKPVGIDIEEIQFDEYLAKVIFNPEELEAVRSADDPAVKFTEFWTRKESFLKLTGEGLRDNLKDVLSDANKATISTGINRSAGYMYSVAIWGLNHNLSVTSNIQR